MNDSSILFIRRFLFQLTFCCFSCLFSSCSLWQKAQMANARYDNHQELEQLLNEQCAKITLSKDSSLFTPQTTSNDGDIVTWMERIQEQGRELRKSDQTLLSLFLYPYEEQGTQVKNSSEQRVRLALSIEEAIRNGDKKQSIALLQSYVRKPLIPFHQYRAAYLGMQIAESSSDKESYTQFCKVLSRCPYSWEIRLLGNYYLAQRKSPRRDQKLLSRFYPENDVVQNPEAHRLLKALRKDAKMDQYLQKGFKGATFSEIWGDIPNTDSWYKMYR